MRIYYYVSGHGFGHISRSSIILKRLLQEPTINEIHLVSSRIDFIKWEDPKLIKRNITLDVGVIQKDSLSLDIEKTKEALEFFESNKTSVLGSEAQYCRENKIDLILTDAASFPIVIALEIEIPSIFIGNFTWDFIYQNYSNFDPYFGQISEKYRTEYSFATEAIFLPFTCPMPPFLETSRVGLVGRESKLTKVDAKRQFGFDSKYVYILLSFGAYGLSGFELLWNQLPNHIKLVAYGVPGIDSSHVITPPECYYPDLIRASDYVLTKPGYGILSECFYAETPILYTDRGDFAEYPQLVKILEANFNCNYISHEDISNCRFSESISIINNQNKMKKNLNIDFNGENEITRLILAYT